VWGAQVKVAFGDLMRLLAARIAARGGLTHAPLPGATTCNPLNAASAAARAGARSGDVAGGFVGLGGDNATHVDVVPAPEARPRRSSPATSETAAAAASSRASRTSPAMSALRVKRPSPAPDVIASLQRSRRVSPVLSGAAVYMQQLHALGGSWAARGHRGSSTLHAGFKGGTGVLGGLTAIELATPPAAAAASSAVPARAIGLYAEPPPPPLSSAFAPQAGAGAAVGAPPLASVAAAAAELRVNAAPAARPHTSTTAAKRLSMAALGIAPET